VKKPNGKGTAGRLPEACIARPALEELFGKLDARLDRQHALLRRILLALDVDPDAEGL
jgi:hypothetical protein